MLFASCRPVLDQSLFRIKNFKFACENKLCFVFFKEIYLCVHLAFSRAHPAINFSFFSLVQNCATISVLGFSKCESVSETLPTCLVIRNTEAGLRIRNILGS